MPPPLSLSLFFTIRFLHALRHPFPLPLPFSFMLLLGVLKILNPQKQVYAKKKNKGDELASSETNTVFIFVLCM